jgi:hypothetical protein
MSVVMNQQQPETPKQKSDDPFFERAFDVPRSVFYRGRMHHSRHTNSFRKASETQRIIELARHRKPK